MQLKPSFSDSVQELIKNKIELTDIRIDRENEFFWELRMNVFLYFPLDLRLGS